MARQTWPWVLQLTLRRRRSEIRRALRALAMLAVLAFIAPLVFDLTTGYNRKDVHTSFDVPASARYEASLSLSKLTLNTATHTASGNLEYKVSARQAGPDIDRVSLGLQDNPDGTQALMDFTSAELGAQSNGPLDSLVTADGVPEARISITPELGVWQVRQSAYYPFDSYSFDLDILGCANDNISAYAKCSIGTKELAISVSDPFFTVAQAAPAGNGHGIRYVLQRPFFVRWVSGWVVAFLALFLIYLVRLSDPKDLLIKSAGYFGTMWAFRQLIVPSAIPIFPTIIDYSILFLFGILFIVVTYRAMLGQLEVSDE